ncbi:alpha-(1,3)-fucosyltransferase C-like [Pollicipes pollicipes]|nr:alpha-(1,3)-fucosyltransferase C-like [Pollicipes pollicipes]
MEFSDLDLPSWRHPDQLWVFFMLESPPHTTAKFTEATRHLFNLTVTYRRDSDIRQPYFVVERLPESERRPAQVATGRPTPPWAALARRKGRLPWVVSHCRTPGKREEFVEELRSYIAVDVFGRCGPLKCSPPGGLFTLPDPRTCYRHLAENYHFYLSLENSRCRDYITEKFFLALNSSLVPVVYGARREDYAAVAPPHSFIHVDDFESARELASYLRYLTAHPAALDAYTAWRGEYRVRGAVHDSWCKLCERLHDASAPRSTHPDINAWWNGPDTCW